MVQFEDARGSPVVPALITSLNLKPKVEKGTALSDSLAVQIDAHVCFGRDRPYETFTAEFAHH